MGDTYEYEVYTNVAGAPDLLSKLRSFAIANGWTINEWETDVDWDDPTPGTYEWVSGTGDFLDMESNGYGSQVLRFRFRDETDAGITGDSGHHHLWALNGVFDVSYGTGSTHPAHQNRWGTHSSGYGKMSVPSGSIHKVHYIGNDKCIVVVVQLSPTCCVEFAFGTWELANAYQGTTDCMMQCTGWNWAYMTNYTTYVNSITSNRSRVSTWLGCNYMSGLTTHTPWYFDGRSCSYTRARQSLECRNSEDALYIQDLTGQGFRQRRLLGRNLYSTKRPMFQPSLVMRQASDERTVCTGMMPGYYTTFDGLIPGQFLEHGTDTYVVFPWTDVHRWIGWAMKVNV